MKLPIVNFHLRDLQPMMVESWTQSFDGIDKDLVFYSCGDIFDTDLTKVDAIVSPANSFGYMDGGIDAVYTRRFGKQLQERLQGIIKSHHHGELPVGQAQIVHTGERAEEGIPYLVSAPTMRVPENIENTVNAYLAFRAVIRSVLLHNMAIYRAHEVGQEVPHDYIATVLCPGLGTAVGGMPFDRCAFQMRRAYNKTFMQETDILSMSVCAQEHRHLKGT